MSQPIIEPRLLKGFRDILPDKMRTRQHMIRTVESVLQTFGFGPLETPALEYADILLGKLGDEGEKLLYRFKDHGDRDVAMRYDFTVPLARVVAQYPDLLKPFKRYQVGPVWRADNTQRGRYREFYQLDMDIVGSDSNIADAEILVTMQESLLALGIHDFEIRINHRQLLSDIVQRVGLNTYQKQQFYSGLDKWDKIGGVNGVTSFWQQNGLDHEQIGQLLTALESIEDHPVTAAIELATSLGLKPQHYRLDPTIVRGLDYYTGIVFETTLVNAPEFGSVFSGGRYDDLVGRFAKQPVPAVGASIGVDRLATALEELGVLASKNTITQVFVTIFNDELLDVSLRTASALRQAGIATEVSYQTGNLGKQLKIAAARQVDWVIIIGPDEAREGQLTVRNLQTGQEYTSSLPELIRRLAA